MPAIRIHIDFYDEAEKQLILKRYPDDFKLISSKIGTLNLSFSDFQAYSLFRHQLERPGFSTFQDWSWRAALCWPEMTLYLSLNSNNNLICTYPDNVDVTNIAEALGVAGGLSVTGHLYGLHQADFKRIPRRRMRDMDFEIASPIKGRRLSIEAKGAIVQDNTVKSQAISNHKAGIKSKKEAIDKRTVGNSNTTGLGVITVASRMDQPLTCWIVDPPADDSNSDLDKDRLLARLYYYTEILGWISPRSVLVALLINRIRSIEASSNFTDFNKLALVDSNNEEILIKENFVTSRPHILEQWLGGQTRLHRDKICGRIAVMSRVIWFIGLPITAIQMLVNQDFNFIMNYNKISERFPGILRGRMTRTDLNSLDSQLHNLVVSDYQRDQDKPIFENSASFDIASSGVVWSRIGFEDRATKTEQIE